MTSMYSYVKEYLSPSKTKTEEEHAEEGTANGGTAMASETTSLLNHTASSNDETEPIDNTANGNDETKDAIQHDVLHPFPEQSPSVHDFYFTSQNPTVQRYYRFRATPITPIVALHKRPGGGNSAMITNNVTGLLRRSAVVPSHGTDTTGDWILVSVGGRSGWARKKRPEQHFSGFTLAETFKATEGWMGNHAFFCRGKMMLGSDAPSLVFTNLLLLVGYAFHFAIVLPALEQIEEQHPDAWFTLHTPTIFWLSVVLGAVSFITLWMTALMDPGIIPPVSSPVRAPVPPEHIALGGPLGYRYCSSCNIFRPPRSKHCNSCNVCVSKFDQ